MAAAQEFAVSELVDTVAAIAADDESHTAIDGLKQVVDVIADNIDGRTLIRSMVEDAEHRDFMESCFEEAKNVMSAPYSSYEEYLEASQEGLLAVRDEVHSTLSGKSPNAGVFHPFTLRMCKEMGVNESEYVIVINLGECDDPLRYQKDRRPDGVSLETHANNVTFHKAMRYFPELRHTADPRVYFHYEDGRLVVSASATFDPETMSYGHFRNYTIKHWDADKMLADIGCTHYYLFEKLE